MQINSRDRDKIQQPGAQPKPGAQSTARVIGEQKSGLEFFKKFFTRFSSRFKAIGIALGTTVFVLAITLLCWGRSSRTLTDMQAMDYAQLGRNLAAGRGFSTNIIRPLALESLPQSSGAPSGSLKPASPASPAATAESGTPTPETTNAPLWAFLLGCVFSLASVNDDTVINLSLGFHLVSALLLFLLARRLSGDLMTAGLTVCIFAVSQPVLVMAGSGRPAVLGTCLFLALLLVLTPANLSRASEITAESSDAETSAMAIAETNSLEPRRNELEPSEPQGDKAAFSDAQQKQPDASSVAAKPRAWSRYFVAGCLASLCYLTDYAALLWVVPFVLFWGEGIRRWSRIQVMAFVGGLLLIALPWWIRNARLTGNPFYTLQWAELTMYSAQFPGASRYRDLDGASSVGAFFIEHPLSFLRKVVSGLIVFVEEIPRFPHLYLMPFILAAYWLRPGARGISAFKMPTAVALGLSVIGLAMLGRTSSQQLLPLAGPLAFMGTGTLLVLLNQVIDNWVRKASPDAVRPADISSFRKRPAHEVADFVARRWRRRQRSVPAVRWAGVALLLGLLMLPSARLIIGAQRPTSQALADLVRSTNRALTSQNATATDIPWALAWYGNRKAAWLPYAPGQMAALQSKQNMGAVYLSPLTSRYPADEKIEEWQLLYQNATVGRPAQLDGYQVMARPAVPDVLYVKSPSLAEAQRLVRASPKSAAAFETVGGIHLEKKRYRLALDAFLSARQLQPGRVQPYLGAGVASMRLKSYGSAAKFYGQALQRMPRSVPARMGLAEALLGQRRYAAATVAYEQVLADSPNHEIAMNNLAYLYARDNRDLLRALEMAKRAAMANPANGEMMDTLGWVCHRLGREQEAIAYLQHAVKLMPRKGLAYYHLGMASRRTKPKNAAEVLRQAVILGLPAAEKKTAEATLTQFSRGR